MASALSLAAICTLARSPTRGRSRADMDINTDIAGMPLEVFFAVAIGGPVLLCVCFWCLLCHWSGISWWCRRHLGDTTTTTTTTFVPARATDEEMDPSPVLPAKLNPISPPATLPAKQAGRALPTPKEARTPPRRRSDEAAGREVDGAEAPKRFLCPITLQVMRRPFMTRDGHNYERDAIMDWIKKNGVCPQTRRPLQQKDLGPNRALQEEIDEWVEKNYSPQLSASHDSAAHDSAADDSAADDSLL